MMDMLARLGRVAPVVTLLTLFSFSTLPAQSDSSSSTRSNPSTSSRVRTTAPPRTSRSSRRIPPSRSTPRRPASTSSTRTPVRTSTGTKPSTPAGEKKTPAKPGNADPADEKASSSEAGLVERVSTYVQENLTLVIGVVVGALVALMGLRILGRRRQASLETDDDYELVPLGSRADDDEGPRRVLIDPVTGKPRSLPSRQDSEYALVLEEDVLHGDEAPAEAEAADEPTFENLVQKGDYDSAYRHYERNLVSSNDDPVNPRAERALSYHYLSHGDFDRAENILTHHLRTQSSESLDPDAYFDMAYLAFKKNKLAQSKDFFRRYAELGQDPRLTERARTVLEKLESL